MGQARSDTDSPKQRGFFEDGVPGFSFGGTAEFEPKVKVLRKWQ
jgi:hypothetical protein